MQNNLFFQNNLTYWLKLGLTEDWQANFAYTDSTPSHTQLTKFCLVSLPILSVIPTIKLLVFFIQLCQLPQQERHFPTVLCCCCCLITQTLLSNKKSYWDYLQNGARTWQLCNRSSLSISRETQVVETSIAACTCCFPPSTSKVLGSIPSPHTMHCTLVR